MTTLRRGWGGRGLPLHFLTGLRPLQAQGPPKFKVSLAGGGRGEGKRGEECHPPSPCIGCGRGGGSYIQSQQYSPHTSNAAKYWRKERGSWGASSSKTFPPGPSPPYCLRENIVFSRTLTLLKPGRSRWREPLHPQGQLCSPNTDPVATLVQNKQKTPKQKNVVSRDGWEKKTGATPHFPRAGRRNTFMEGRQWQNPALILHSEQ